MARQVSEEFLHYIWKFRLFDMSDLHTTANEQVRVHTPGSHNTHAGPDFYNAKVTIGDTLWAGNVELHVQEKEWLTHGHQHDKAYDNVILHVVYEADHTVPPREGGLMPTLELRKRIDPAIIVKYESLMTMRDWVPCANTARHVDKLVWDHWLERIMTERLSEKTQSVEKELQSNRNDWEQTMYAMLARSFGFKVNSLPMEILARALPYDIISKCQTNKLQLEALLFGQAGFLEGDIADDYMNELSREYHYLKNKYKLKPISNHLWKFLRLRPVNFPTIRLAQFADLLHNNGSFFSKILSLEKTDALINQLCAEADGYWKEHYHFGKKSSTKIKSLGKLSKQVIVINTIVPVLFSYGKYIADQTVCERAIELLSQLPAEKNSIIRKWQDAGIKAEDAGQSQALIHLKDKYCNMKKCLNCSIGTHLIR